MGGGRSPRSDRGLEAGRPLSAAGAAKPLRTCLCRQRVWTVRGSCLPIPVPTRWTCCIKRIVQSGELDLARACQRGHGIRIASEPATMRLGHTGRVGAHHRFAGAATSTLRGAAKHHTRRPRSDPPGYGNAWTSHPSLGGMRASTPSRTRWSAPHSPFPHQRERHGRAGAVYRRREPSAPSTAARRSSTGPPRRWSRADRFRSKMRSSVSTHGVAL